AMNTVLELQKLAHD
nr:Chain A, Class III lanthipeptide [Bacillus thuringiensis serovar andalousiensis]8SAO_C Chain C, Class III lanthipeptide [Bacillus thuringiensis serovar andalousiensis]